MPWEGDVLRQPSTHFAVRTQTQNKVTEEEGRTAQTYCFSCTKGSRGSENGKTPEAMAASRGGWKSVSQEAWSVCPGYLAEDQSRNYPLILAGFCNCLP